MAGDGCEWSIGLVTLDMDAYSLAEHVCGAAFLLIVTKDIFVCCL